MTGRLATSGPLREFVELGYDLRLWPDQPFASQRWQKLVKQYSALLLSKEKKGRLPALSRMVSRGSPHLSEYCAGLWKTTFAPNLLWRASRLDTGAAPQGPSWSWTAVTGAVWYWDHLRVMVSCRENERWERGPPIFYLCSVQSVGKNPLGEVAPGGEMGMKGSLLRTRLWSNRALPSNHETTGSPDPLPLRLQG